MADGRHSPPCVRNTTGHTGLELPCKKKHVCVMRFMLFRISFKASLTTVPVKITQSHFCVCHSVGSFVRLQLEFRRMIFYEFTALIYFNQAAHLNWTRFCCLSLMPSVILQELDFCVTACFNSTDTLLLPMLHPRQLWLLTYWQWHFLITKNLSCLVFFLAHTLILKYLFCWEILTWLWHWIFSLSAV